MSIPEHITKLNNEPTNDWTFRPETVYAVMGFDLSTQDIWAAANTEIAKAQVLLNAYKTAFEIGRDQDLYTHLKSRKNFEDGIDYLYFQQYIVDTYMVMNGDLELWHKRPNKQYMRDRFYFAMHVMLSNIIYAKYLPAMDARNLINKTSEIASIIKGIDAKNKADKRWTKYKDEEEFVFGCFKEDYENNVDGRFGTERPYYNKIDHISKYVVKGKNLGINKAKSWYSRVRKEVN